MQRDIFQAIADPTRRSIILMVSDKAMTPNALAGKFNTTRQAVSKHIRILAECKLLTQQKSGREIHYHLNPERMMEVDLWLEQFRMHWEKRFRQLDNVLVKLKTKKK